MSFAYPYNIRKNVRLFRIATEWLDTHSKTLGVNPNLSYAK